MLLLQHSAEHAAYSHPGSFLRNIVTNPQTPPHPDAQILGPEYPDVDNGVIVWTE